MIALVICNELDKGAEFAENTFLATLTRDFGMLHIDPDVIGKQGIYTTDEWKLLQGHVAIGHHLLSIVPKLPPRVSQAVLEHHERTDGLGYPLGKVAGQLTQEGQIIALVDTSLALYYKYVADQGYPLAALIPILQINAGIHMHENTNALLRFLNKSVTLGIKPLSQQQLTEQIKQITELGLRVGNWFNVAGKLAQSVTTTYKCSTQSANKILKVAQRIESVFTTSGLNDPTLASWLQTLGNSGYQPAQDELIEIERYTLMLNESCWQLEQLLKHLGGIRGKISSPALAANFNKRYALLEKELTDMKKSLI